MFTDSETHAELVRLVEAATDHATCDWIPQLGRELTRRFGYAEDQLVDNDTYRAALAVFTTLVEVKAQLKRVERCASE